MEKGDRRKERKRRRERKIQKCAAIQASIPTRVSVDPSKSSRNLVRLNRAGLAAVRIASIGKEVEKEDERGKFGG